MHFVTMGISVLLAGLVAAPAFGPHGWAVVLVAMFAAAATALPAARYRRLPCFGED